MKINLKSISLYLLPFLGGLLYAMGFPMKSLPALFPFALLGIFCLLFSLKPLQVKNLKFNIGMTLLFSLGYNLLGYYWIPETLKIFGNVFFPFNYCLGLLFSLIIAPHYLLFTLLTSVIPKISQIPSAYKNISIALILTLFEYFTPQQFPAHLGHSWLPLASYLKLAPLLGAPFYSFISFWIILALIAFIKSKQKDFYLLAILALTTLAHLIIPFPQLAAEKKYYSRFIRVVQPNIGSLMKVSSETGVFNADRKSVV